MKKKIQLSILAILIGHLLLLSFTQFSFIGFWTDSLIPIILVFYRYPLN